MVRNFIIFAVLISCVLSTGCANRRLIVRSEPEGAFLTVDGYPVGYTPVATSYVYGGVRELQLEQDGYETIRVQQDLKDPWYLRPPFSFVTENFSPVEIRHQPVLDFTMQPKSQVNESALLDRANLLRSNVQRGTVTAPSR